jgi:hypothetical protein
MLVRPLIVLFVDLFVVLVQYLVVRRQHGEIMILLFVKKT